MGGEIFIQKLTFPLTDRKERIHVCNVGEIIRGYSEFRGTGFNLCACAFRFIN